MQVPYENVDIYRGRPPGIEPLDCVERILGGRGGYCYHLNGALVTLLEWLQVDVTRHLSGVLSGSVTGVPERLSGNHLGITARTTDGAEWFVDAGLGDGPVDPLPLVFGTYEEEGFTYALQPSGADGWRFEHDPRGAFTCADFGQPTATTADFREKHVELSTSPESGFVRVAAIMRRIPGGVEILRGCEHSTTTSSGTTRSAVGSADDWWGIVIDGFGLAYGDLPADERDRVWAMVLEAHEAWLAASGGGSG
jgi:N-hydroxyarylamine O-acetyltransferase